MERAQSAAGWHPSLDEQSLLVQIWGNFTNRYHEPGLAMSEDLFNALPLELQLHIADAVGERCDRAALALASPRLLAACHELPSCQGLEMSLAFHYVLGGAIDEQLLRGYASRSEATPEGCEWLAGVDAAAGVLVVELVCSAQQWRLRSGATRALLRIEGPSRAVSHFYEGKYGKEYAVRSVEPDGSVWHFEGKQGMERRVRFVPADGGVWHYTGKKRAWWLVCSSVIHFEGECGAEHIVRCEPPLRTGPYRCLTIGAIYMASAG